MESDVWRVEWSGVVGRGLLLSVEWCWQALRSVERSVVHWSGEWGVESGEWRRVGTRFVESGVRSGVLKWSDEERSGQE